MLGIFRINKKYEHFVYAQWLRLVNIYLWLKNNGMPNLNKGTI